MTVYVRQRAGYVGEVDRIGDQYVAAVFGPDMWVQDLGTHATSLQAIAAVDGALATLSQIAQLPETEAAHV